jgi:hypothetical protein
MSTLFNLSPKQLLLILAACIAGFALLPGIYKWVWMAACLAYAAWKQLESIREIWPQMHHPIVTAKEILAVMTPVAVLPPRDPDLQQYSMPLRIGRLLENGNFEMYFGDIFVRYRYNDGAYVSMQSRRIEFDATHWQVIPYN